MKNIFLLFFLFGSLGFAQKIPFKSNQATSNDFMIPFFDSFAFINKQNSKGPSCKISTSAKKSVLCNVPKNDTGECRDIFMKTDCSLGSEGQRMKKLFATSYQTKAGDIVPLSTLVTRPPADILEACPKYHTLSKDLKENFWIWMMGVLAAQENACKDTINTDPPGSGAFQLEESKTARKNLRPNVCTDEFIKKTYPNKRIKDLEPNTHCAMAILATQISPVCGECINAHDKKIEACVTTHNESQKKCNVCLWCRPPSERREDLKVLSRGLLFTTKKRHGGYFRDLNEKDTLRSGLGNKSIKDVISSYPFCH